MKLLLQLIILIYTPVIFAKANSVDATLPPSEGNTPQKKIEKYIEPKFSRGQLLYENHCTTCHASQVHIRSNRKARSVEDVRGWVIHWERELKLNWNNVDVNDVSKFITERFYKF